ncbi:hypothetical protein ALC57_07822 [Trachymyrmex cornetzi]|uniref:Uncharacterized protein n=1 Tax=Trachymyrmex cornetzi TaxID=471704 RepID=A0A195E4E4_9HYME|nr:hypothetical protein ALC57_07822 [Trachymyrmex cornetzi]
MKSSNILDSENNSEFEEEHNEFVHKENEILKKIIYMPTLPSTFNSLVKKTVKLKTDEPRCVIELVGDLLGVKDYGISKAAFWFLDIVAFQVLRYKNCLDDHYRSILISWYNNGNRYVNELRYAVFVNPIQMQMFLMPYAYQIQHQIKLAHSRGSFNIQLRERLEEVARESIINNGKKITDDMRKDQMIEDFEILPIPPSLLNEEEILANNCRFILPLIEANKAAQIFEMHAGSM